MKYIKKTYVKKGSLYLGSGKVQRGEFLPFLAAASRFIPIIPINCLARENLGKG